MTKFLRRWGNESIDDLKKQSTEKHEQQKKKRAGKTNFCTRLQLAVIYEQAFTGASKSDTAHRLGIDPSTFDVWLRDREPVKREWKRGRVDSREKIRKNLFKIAGEESKQQLRALIYLGDKFVWRDDKREKQAQPLQVDINLDALTKYQGGADSGE